MPGLLEILPDRVRLPMTFDAAALAADLGAFDESDWTAHFVRDNYEGEWSALPLRAAAGETHKLRMIFANPTASVFADTPFLGRAPAIRAALARFECPLKAVRLMRLAAGSVIKEHDDFDPDAASGTARLHVPITTGPEVEFLLNRKPVPMAPGEVWYLRLADPHSVANRGTRDRVHLVIDTWTNAWLEALLRAGAR
ncbi:MAG TPA: aspartyl/asparaginyl beta-hydroxylase domain-containing protein [Allosphingosinicella sp.]|nr:aspartyl/asparaginyl beta-hydroxylase domain-containing protein [Allosphingosinicella sp.]